MIETVDKICLLIFSSMMLKSQPASKLSTNDARTPEDPNHPGTDRFEDESYCRIKIAPLYYPPNKIPERIRLIELLRLDFRERRPAY